MLFVIFDELKKSKQELFTIWRVTVSVYTEAQKAMACKN